MSRLRALRVPALCSALLLGAVALPAEASAAQQLPTLVAIRAAHHPTFDRVVFEFAGGLPASRQYAYVPAVVGDPSGEPVPLAGDAFLTVRMEQGVGHDDNGNVTYGPTRRTYALPNVIQVANAGDFEGVLTFGIGLAARTPVRLSTLTNPSRVVVDIDAAFQTVDVSAHFLDQARFEANTPPFTRAVPRPVAPPATARGALQRLFAGPTAAELAQRLRFVNSDATGFADLSIRDSIARVRLTGGCSSHGATFTVADEITATLKQFGSVRWVKVHDPAGNTGRPDGPVDSIPECLEP